MKKRFTEELIIGFLREAEDGLPIKELETEDSRLKKLLAESGRAGADPGISPSAPPLWREPA